MIWWCVLVQMQFPPTTIHEVFWHQDSIQWSSESDCTLLLLGRWNLRDEQFCCSFSFIKFLCYIWTMLGLTKTIPDWSYTIFIFHFLSRCVSCLDALSSRSSCQVLWISYHLSNCQLSLYPTPCWLTDMLETGCILGKDVNF